MDERDNPRAIKHALEDGRDLKFSREQGFFDKSKVVTFLIAAVFFFSTFAMLHFREIHVDVLEPGTIAPKYVVAQVDIEFLDEEATAILRQEAVRDIGKIYRISEKNIRARRMEFEKYLVSNPEWRQQFADSSFKEIYNGIDVLTRALAQARFTDPRTLTKVKEAHLGTAEYYLFTPLNMSESAPLPQHVWDAIQEQTLPETAFDRESSAFIIAYFKSKPWLLEEDVPAQRILRKQIQLTVPDQYSFVSAGNRLIDKGEKVAARHISMLQAMKDSLSERRSLWNPLTLLGSLLMALFLTGICAAYLYANHPYLLNSNRNLSLIVTIIAMTFIFAKVVEFFLLNVKSNLFEVIHYPLFIPFAAILVCNLINAPVATFVSGFLAVVLTMTLAFDKSGFMIINIASAIVAILATHSLRHRKEIFIVCAQSWFACSIGIIALYFYENTMWSFAILGDIAGSGVFMLFTAILVVGLLPLLETGFHVMTDVSLMEYMDPNLEILRRLSIEAPGTYQHSLIVGSIAEAAALSIGANGLFCRVATLFHDVGKMTTAQYFTENQQGMVNIHQLLTPAESAQVIIAHVSEGVKLARKAALPEQFIDVIKEHHGTTLVYYFYRKQLDLVGGDKALVDVKNFRYAGPKPRTKESAIIMIADSFEAASRSLERADEESLTALINRLIREKADDGQFDDCLLTFEELGTVKKTMVKTLIASGHSRIKYPLKEESCGRL